MTADKVVDFVLSGVDSNIPKDDITFFDYLFIAFLRKISTLGSRMLTIPSTCPLCDFVNASALDSEKMEFVDLTCAVPLKVRIGPTTEVEMAPITVGNYKSLVKIGKENDDVYLLAAGIRGMLLDQAHKLVFEATGPAVFAALEEADKALYHGIKSIAVTCKGVIGEGPEKRDCGTKYTVAVDDGDTVVLPFREQNPSDTG